MPRTRNEAAQAVADAFLPAERSAQETAAQAARCIATIIEQRTKAKVSAVTGAEALALIAEGTQHSLAAANAFASAHVLLAELPVELGLTTSFGPDCEPNRAYHSPALTVVA